MTTWLFEPGIVGAEASDALDLTLRFEGDVTVCVLDGHLDTHTVATLDSWLEQLHVNGRHRVAVDVAAVDTTSIEGIGVLAAHAARLRAAGGVLQIRSPSVPVRRVFDRCGAGHLLQDGPEG